LKLKIKGLKKTTTEEEERFLFEKMGENILKFLMKRGVLGV